MSSFDFAPPGKRDIQEMTHRPFWETGGTFEKEYFIDGRQKIQELTASPMSYRGIDAVVGVGRDITEHILYVDDELPLASMGGRMLESPGYAVTTRTSSLEALELFRAKPNEFDLVITDMTMPNMTGDQLAVELMKIRIDIPIILCTGYSKKISDKAAFDVGIRAYAYKPIVRAELAKTVRKVLDEGIQKP